MPSGPEVSWPERPTIVMFSSAELGEASGPAIHVINLANALSKIAAVTLIVPQPRAAPVVPLDPAVSMRNVPSPRRLKLPGGHGLPGGLAFALMPGALWQARAADMVLVRSAPGSIIASLFARMLRVKRLGLELNGWIAGEAGTLGARALAMRLLGAMQVWEARLAHAIRTVTPELKARLVDAGIAADKIAVIPTGAQLDVFFPRERAQCRYDIGLPDAGYRAVFIGNLWDAIDLETAFRALALLKAQGIALALTVVGDGPAGPRLKKLASEIAPKGAVTFVGSLPPAKAAIHLGAADFAIAPFAPAHAGLSPLKMRDYAAGGRMVVASDLPGIRLEGSDEWLIPVTAQDASALAQGMTQALNQNTPCRESAARAYAEAHFGWDSIAKAALAHYLRRQ